MPKNGGKANVGAKALQKAGRGVKHAGRGGSGPMGADREHLKPSEGK